MLKPAKTLRQLRLSEKTLPKLSLQALLIVPFVLQIFAAVGLTGYLSFRNGQKAINELANRLSSEVSHRIDQQLDTYLATPQQINEINADAVNTGQLNLKDLPRLGRFFWKQVQVFNVGYITYILAEGNYADAGYFLDPGNIFIGEISVNTKGKSYSYATDSQGNRTNLHDIADYNPREDSVYINIVKSGKRSWGKLHIGMIIQTFYQFLRAIRSTKIILCKEF